MKRLAGALLLVLAGCASAPVATDPAVAARAHIHAELAAAYAQRGQLQVALEEANTALAADGRYAPALAIRALIEMTLHEDAPAEQDFRQSLALAPHDPDTLNNFGWFLCTRGRPADSLQYFDAAVSRPFYPLKAESLANAGLCAAKLGQNARAGQYYRRALAIDPGQLNALRGLGELAWRQGDAAGAADYARRRLAAGAADAASLWLAVRADHALGRRGAEAGDARALLQQFPDSPQVVALKNRNYDER